MPVMTVKKKGKTFYRWGTRGKLYRTKAGAARQGKAITKAQSRRRRLY